MMCRLVILFGIIALSAGFPRLPTALHPLSLANRFVLEKRYEPGAACGQSLSDAVSDVISLALEIPELRPLPFDAEVHKQFLVRMLGYDVFDEDIRLEKSCELTKVTTVAELKAVQNDVLYSQLRFGYDYIAAVYPLTLESPELRDLASVLESLGLTSLDPEGVSWLLDVTGLGLLVADYVPASVSNASLEEKSTTLQTLVNSAIDSATEENPLIMYLVGEDIKEHTGIDIHDSDQLNALLYVIMEAVETGELRAVYDVIDDNGVVDTAFQAYYPQLVAYVKETKLQLQGLAALLEHMLNGPGNGGSPYGKGGYYGKGRHRRSLIPPTYELKRRYGENDANEKHHGKPHGKGKSGYGNGKSGYGKGKSGYGKGKPSGGGNFDPDLLALMKATITLIEEVEKAGLLDLPPGLNA